MNENLILIEKINKFIKPLADLLLFLFTTQTGMLVLSFTFLLFLILKVANRVNQTKLLYDASRHSGIPLAAFLRIVFEEIGSFAAKIFANITTLAVIVFLMLGIVTISFTINAVDNFFKNEQKIKELKQVVKNLNQNYKVAKVEITDYNLLGDTTKIKVSFYDYSKTNQITNVQQINLPGKDIYFVSLVMNFDYSLIETGRNINIALPFAVFTSKMKQEDAIKLNYADSLGIPLIFKRDTNDVYGINYTTYNDRLKEIVEFIDNPKKAKEAGIRSQYNAAPHFVKVITKGQTFYIIVEQTGGLVLKPEL